jgi:hypothetical protein
MSIEKKHQEHTDTSVSQIKSFADCADIHIHAGIEVYDYVFLCHDLLSHYYLSFRPTPTQYIWKTIRQELYKGNQQIKGEALLFLPNRFRSFLGKNRHSFHLQPSNDENETDQKSFVFALVRPRPLCNATLSWPDDMVAAYMDCSLTLAGRLLWLTRWWSQTTKSSM